MVNGFNEDGCVNNWRAVNIQAGAYQVNVGSTYPEDDLNTIVEYALAKLIVVKSTIPVDKPASNAEVL